MPYRFLDSEKHERKLILTLESNGYQFNIKEKSYRLEIMKFNRIWNVSEILLIKWTKDFVSDGTEEQDSQVIVSINDIEVGIINIDNLLKSKLQSTLNEEVCNGIIKIIKTHNNM